VRDKYAIEAMMRNNQEVAEQNKEILFKYGLVRMSSGIVDYEVNKTFKLSYVWEFVDKSAYEACSKILDKLVEKFEPTQNDMPRRTIGECSRTYMSISK
jgi:hypothetical protein